MKKGKSSQEIRLLLWAIDEGFNHAAWHGPNLKGSLRGVTAAQAAWRPAPGRHNIWEIVVHAAYWKYAVRRRLRSGKRGGFTEKGSNWFRRGDAPNSKAWQEDLALLHHEHQNLRAAVAAEDPAHIHRRPSPKGRPPIAHILGIAFHDVYHAGQIRLLRRLQRLHPKHR